MVDSTETRWTTRNIHPSKQCRKFGNIISLYSAANVKTPTGPKNQLSCTSTTRTNVAAAQVRQGVNEGGVVLSLQLQQLFARISRTCAETATPIHTDRLLPRASGVNWDEWLPPTMRFRFTTVSLFGCLTGSFNNYWVLIRSLWILQKWLDIIQSARFWVTLTQSQGH